MLISLNSTFSCKKNEFHSSKNKWELPGIPAIFVSISSENTVYGELAPANFNITRIELC